MPPLGPGAEIGKSYHYSLYLHCGVRDIYFNGMVWIANPTLGDGNPPTGWSNLPTDWIQKDSVGSITLVRDDLAIFTAESGRVIEFIPWLKDVQYIGCF